MALNRFSKITFKLGTSKIALLTKFTFLLIARNLNPISAGGGVESTPPGFSLAIATNINRSTPNILTFKLYKNLTKIKFITCQGLT